MGLFDAGATLAEFSVDEVVALMGEVTCFFQHTATASVKVKDILLESTNLRALLSQTPKSPPTSPSPTESKRLFYTSVSLLLSRIQG